MATFYFYASEADRILILREILTEGIYTLIGNRDYPQPKPYVFSKISKALLENISINKLLFIHGPFCKLGIQMKRLDGGECAGSYIVNYNHGGPLLELSLPGARKEADTVKLVPGDISHAPYYWNLDDATTFKPSDELKLHFRILIKKIKRHLTRYDIGKQIWIGTDARLLLEHGGAKILSDGKWMGISDFKKMS